VSPISCEEGSRDVSEPNVTSGYGSPRSGFLRRWRWRLIIGGPLLILLVAGYFVLISGRFETTDNAYIQIAKVPVAPSIGGRVTDVYVKENQLVHRGDALFRIDTRDLRANADAAAAQAAGAELQLNVLRAAYRQQLASVEGARANVAYTVREAARQHELAAAGVSSQAQVDQAAHAAQEARDALAVAQHQAAQALANLGGRADISAGAVPSVMQARAQLERARLNISYGTVVAPSDGIVTRVEQMPLGTYLSPAQTAFWLLSGRAWIEANFKEDQLAHMKVGQPVKIRIDADPDADIRGHVSSFSPATGQSFSLLPAQNATGNWVKVVQRLPVRIDFDKAPPEMAARAGLSAKVTVDVRASPGRSG
jgi:membrane fusion protein (multidrug efflux system)